MKSSVTICSSFYCSYELRNVQFAWSLWGVFGGKRCCQFGIIVKILKQLDCLLVVLAQKMIFQSIERANKDPILPLETGRLAEGSNASSSELRHCVWIPSRKKKHVFFASSRWSYWQYWTPWPRWGLGLVSSLLYWSGYQGSLKSHYDHSLLSSTCPW